MDDLISGFGNLKVSALSKSKNLNSQIKNMTLGPDRRLESETGMAKKAPSYSRPKPRIKKMSSDTGASSIFTRALGDMEVERQNKLHKAINGHVSSFEEFSKMQELSGRQEWLKRQQGIIAASQQKEYEILKELEQHDKNIVKEQQRALKEYQERIDLQRKHEAELRANERHKQQIRTIIDRITKDQQEFRSIYQEIITIIQNFKFQDQLKMHCGEPLKLVKTLPDTMEEVVKCCKIGRISESESAKSRELVQLLVRLKTIIQDKCDFITRQAKAPTPSHPRERKPSDVRVISENIEPVSNEISKADAFVSKDSLNLYIQLQEFGENYIRGYKELLDGVNYKKFRFECKKAVNAPVNAISAVTFQHLLDKYRRLSNLLSGKPVEIGEKVLNVSSHSQGVAFCTDLLAKQFVLQGDLMISSKPESAFVYAAVIVRLWSNYPDFGKLLLNHFYKQCPYLVPIYPPRTVDQSDRDFYLSQGYQYIDGVVEKHDKFLKRMSGIMRLYFAILITSSNRGNGPGLLDLREGWRWLSAILNLKPRHDITATALHIFLEIAGHSMHATYSNIFEKVMVFIIDKYMPSFFGNDCGGPVCRLDIFLQEYKKRKIFDPPSGQLPNSFWR